MSQWVEQLLLKIVFEPYPTLAPLTSLEDKNAPSFIFSIKALMKHYRLLTKERYGCVHGLGHLVCHNLCRLNEPRRLWRCRQRCWTLRRKNEKKRKKKAKTLSKGAEAKVHKRTQKWLDPRERGGGGEKAMICFQMFFPTCGWPHQMARDHRPLHIPYY